MASASLHASRPDGTFLDVLRVGFVIAWVASLAGAIAAMGPLRAEDAPDAEFARSIYAYETQAYRDYEFRTMSERVLQRSDELWHRHMEIAKSGKAPNCAAALRLLSMMVQESYFASRRGEVPFDWLDMAPTYIELRTGCYRSLNVDIAQYSLPSAFAR